MKSVILSEEQLSDLNGVGKLLFEDEHDPRSSAYIRVLQRPEISWLRIILCVLVPLLLATGLVVGLRFLELSMPISVVIAVIVLLVYVVLTLKRSVICCIKIYQRYAPDPLRNKCRFEPSCSEYMILSIEKYGLIKGARKGIGRLKRCNVDGGGFDLP